MPDILRTPEARNLVYRRTAGQGPGVVFLGGFKSDMEGTKALYLEQWARARGRAFLRFDYSGHGRSSGAFVDGTIGDWALDARRVVEALTEGPQILVGSSMGGWIALLLAREMPKRVAGLVGIAAAPDFTLAMEAEMNAEQREEMARTGQVRRPSDYSDEPYVITRRLIEEGRQQLILDRPLRLGCPVRLLQGSADTDVPPRVALDLLAHVEAPDVRLTLVKGADHRFSTPECLAMIAEAVAGIPGEA